MVARDGYVDMQEDFPFETNSGHSKARYEVMSEEQIREGDIFLDWFRSAWRDKDNRGLFEKWETVDLYWEGDANPPESDFDPASNTNIVNPNVEGQVGYLVEQNLAIEARPRGPSDKPWADRAKMTMEFVLQQNKMVRKLDMHERRRKKFGTGIFLVRWDWDALDGMGLPWIETWSTAYVFVDPAVTDIYRVQEGRFAALYVNRSINYAREKYDPELVEAIEPGFHPMDAELIFGEETGVTDEISQDSYLHMFVFTRYRHKSEDGETELRLRLVEMSGCGVILRDTKTEEEEDGERIFPDARYPVFFTPDMAREGTVWAKGTSELLIPVQDKIDDYDDQQRYNARLTGNPQRLVDVNSNIDPERITNEPGLSIPTQDMAGYKWVEPPKMPEYILRARDQALGMERQIVSRFGDQQVGIKQQGVDTATEALSLQQGANSGINHSKKLLEETLSDVFVYCLELCMMNWTEEMFFELTEKPGEFDYFRPSDMASIERLMPASASYQQQFATNYPEAQAPRYMPIPATEMIADESGETMERLKYGEDGKPLTLRQKIALNVSVTVGAGLPQNKAFVYSVIKEAQQGGVITPQETRKLLREYVGLPIDEEPPITPEQVQQIVQQALAAAGVAMPMQGGAVPSPGGMQVMPGQTPPNDAIAGMTPAGNPMMPRIGGVA